MVCRGKGRFSAGHRDRLEITAKRDTDLTLWFSTWEFGGQRGREIIYGEENKTNNFQSVEYFLHYIVCSSDGICLKIDFFFKCYGVYECVHAHEFYWIHAHTKYPISFILECLF